jgi:hypothetical protein
MCASLALSLRGRECTVTLLASLSSMMCACFVRGGVTPAGSPQAVVVSVQRPTRHYWPGKRSHRVLVDTGALSFVLLGLVGWLVVAATAAGRRRRLHDTRLPVLQHFRVFRTLPVVVHV